MILFETAESVFEVLWDIALALYILRIGFVYFFLTFSTGTLLSYIVYTKLLPVHHLTTPQSELSIIPIMLVLTMIWSRFVVTYYELPPASTFRLATGFFALGCMAVGELLLASLLYEEGRGAWLLETDLVAGLAFGALLLAFALMPAMMIFWERKVDVCHTSHGHEKKSIANAV